MFFFFNDTATTEIYTLSLHDALPICERHREHRHLRIGALDGEVGARQTGGVALPDPVEQRPRGLLHHRDRKSTRLNSSHANISYAVFCLKKNKHTSIMHIHVYSVSSR